MFIWCLIKCTVGLLEHGCSYILMLIAVSFGESISSKKAQDQGRMEAIKAAPLPMYTFYHNARNSIVEAAFLQSVT